MTVTETDATPVRRRPLVPIVVAALLVAAALAWLRWPGGTSGPTVTKTVAGAYTVQLSVDAPKLGTNTLAVDVADSGGKPVRLDEVTVEPVMPQMGHALTPVKATSDAPGRYLAADTVLPMSGQWELTVSLRGPAGAAQVVLPLLVK
ncbi:FixH family protein [Amycolatopsis sp. H20-H5]|uniref:FixH family protein n=1 Tax=Amycolatopsis sp. H20-H5 TaxID=3046309 RepID=UPI002DBD9586|nr:FixH family protein [Amycolatopsis sp. H20-H5]MEC3975409.1 FixH family protein [Amycolatopsis sp. H20-H5]